MPVTVLQVVNRVRRNLGLDPTITSFSETDESNDNLQDVNEAYEELVIALPSETPYLNNSATITTSNGTRLYSLASDAMPFDLYGWSFNSETDNDAELELVTKDYIQAYDPRYDEVTGTPEYVYLEGNGQIGLYPIPDGTRTINYQYGKSLTSRLSATTDTFIVPDRWVRFIERRAQEKYERRKGYQDPDSSRLDSLELLAEIMAEVWEMNPTYLLTEGF